MRRFVDILKIERKEEEIEREIASIPARHSDNTVPSWTVRKTQPTQL